VPGQPVADAGFVAYEQGFEAIEPSVGVFNHDAAAGEFGVEKGVVVGLPVGGAAVAGDVGFDVPSGTFLPKPLAIKGFIRVWEQAGEWNTRRFEENADFAKQGVQQVALVVITRLRAGVGQGLPPVVGQEQGRRDAGFLQPW